MPHRCCHLPIKFGSRRISQYFTMSREMFTQNYSVLCGSELPTQSSNQWFPASTRVHTLAASRSVYPFLQSLRLWATDTETDHTTDVATAASMHCMHAMRPNNPKPNPNNPERDPNRNTLTLTKGKMSTLVVFWGDMSVGQMSGHVETRERGADVRFRVSIRHKPR